MYVPADPKLKIQRPTPRLDKSRPPAQKRRWRARFTEPLGAVSIMNDRASLCSAGANPKRTRHSRFSAHHRFALQLRKCTGGRDCVEPPDSVSIMNDPSNCSCGRSEAKTQVPGLALKRLKTCVLSAVIVGVMTTFTVTTVADEASESISYYALVIGVNDYQRKPPVGWDQLRTAKKDAEAVANLLEEKYGFTVKRLFDKAATRNAMMAALDEIASRPGDEYVIIYYAGHGYYETDLDEGYWIPSDARMRAGSRLTKEDWIWNSTITKILGAAKPKHILVIADSCYSGSLFRGGEMPAARELQWYRRAMAKPSRYLITSGDLEPVLDSGARHSIFAQQILNYLQYSDHDVFSASDLGHAVRDKVSMMTGQLVRMGHLPVASHAGGEFVFVKKDAALPAPSGRWAVSGNVRGGGEPVINSDELIEQTVRGGGPLRDVLQMNAQGATNASRRMVDALIEKGGDPRLAQSVAAYLDHEKQKEKTQDLRNLIQILSEKKGSVADHKTDGLARPRVVACLGPTSRDPNADPFTEQLYRIALRSELEATGRMQVVERESLERVLEEMNIGTSGLSDDRARLTVGNVLPASLLLMGDLIPRGTGQGLYMRLIDTETTRVLGVASARVAEESELEEASADVIKSITQKAVKARPLEAKVLSVDKGILQAGVGQFHGAAEGQEFSVVHRKMITTGSVLDAREEVLGLARIKALGGVTSDFEVSGKISSQFTSDSNWIIRER